MARKKTQQIFPSPTATTRKRRVSSSFTSSTITTIFPSLFSYRSSVLLLLNVFVLVTVVNANQKSDGQILKRVVDHLDNFMNAPVNAIRRAQRFLAVDGFGGEGGGGDDNKNGSPTSCSASSGLFETEQQNGDYTSYNFDSLRKWLWMELPTLYIYFGLENGAFMIYNDPYSTVPPRLGLMHREPGYSGYPITTTTTTITNSSSASTTTTIEGPSQANLKHWKACVDERGNPINCTLPPGSLYVQCVNDCELQPCGDNVDVVNVDDEDETKKKSESSSIAWCQHYTFKTVQEGEILGRVPTKDSCVDSSGTPSQTLGKVVTGSSYDITPADDDTSLQLGNCYFLDGVTPVNRTLEGDYPSCANENNGGICNANVGAYQTRHYDPRYRPWYIRSREVQRPVWSDPYAFSGGNTIGITYTEPIYSVLRNNEEEKEQKRVFMGVFAVDITLEFIRDFLLQFQNSGFWVLVVESNEPYNVVATSTGGVATRLVYVDNPEMPCAEIDDGSSSNCKVARIPIQALNTSAEEIILQKAFYARALSNFSTDELIAFKTSEGLGDDAYISLGGVFEQPRVSNMKWHVIVATPMLRSSLDSAHVGSAVFYAILIASILGFLFCFTLSFVFFGFRNQRAVQNADWRFTCAFIFGCALLNLSSLALLGENRDELCMLRMWLFNLFFVAALSPLFVKVGRMYKLLYASKHFRRVNVTNFKAMLYTLPLIIVEALLLTIFSFVDPPKGVEYLGGEVLEFGEVQSVTCQYENTNNAFLYTQASYDACLVCIGCYLAYETRNLDEKFGEAKQLAFSMYNIAFTGIIVLLLNRFIEMDNSTKLLLQALAVSWGTILNSGAFVIPRLIQVQEHLKQLRKTQSIHSCKKFILDGNHQVLVDEPTSRRLSSSKRTSSTVMRDGDAEEGTNDNDVDDSQSNHNAIFGHTQQQEIGMYDGGCESKPNEAMEEPPSEGC